MTTEDIYDKWLELIRITKRHDEKMIAKIMLKHNMQKTLACCVSLGRYYDHITERLSSDDYFITEHCEKYGIGLDLYKKAADWPALEG